MQEYTPFSQQIGDEFSSGCLEFTAHGVPIYFYDRSEIPGGSDMEYTMAEIVLAGAIQFANGYQAVILRQTVGNARWAMTLISPEPMDSSVLEAFKLLHSHSYPGTNNHLWVLDGSKGAKYWRQHFNIRDGCLWAIIPSFILLYGAAIVHKPLSRETVLHLLTI